MLWQACQGEKAITPVDGVLYRLVESQEQIATLSLVDNLDEQAILEDLLEQAKPDYPSQDLAHGDLHYLLKTPFRYPPLQWGSRFGQTHEPSIFYGGASEQATLIESAYYRFVFWYAMDAPPIKAKMRTEHTLFTVGYQTDKGIKLHQAPFDGHSDLVNPTDYRICQQLGSAMREAGVIAFEYQSARGKTGDICVGLFEPQALVQRQPLATFGILCEIDADTVAFKLLHQNQVVRFSINDFLINGELPFPA
ncbi:RES family NAD+ phosphorylase [Motilimonas eburnea]|uniref:RES family NAD+ phosphorylase n=1 Tax=Motilimonas eburnea TaxID=1737488 RepID=UPI001E440E34|nr:RES family NAD+ phosphorylase [Motilimonas eburnea]MCE2570508.1 RES family NAD+ phosphorylase [Motilimonas eburnea]